MYCEKCGNKLNEADGFCAECGYKTIHEKNLIVGSAIKFEDKWWFRLAKVVYVLMNVIVIVSVLVAWSINNSKYDYYTKTYTNDIGNALGASIFTLIVGLIIVRLIKISFWYICLAQKPKWKEEFKRIY